MDQFNSGDYWGCHETLEELWRHEADTVRYLYQGILLIGVGLYHTERSNRHGALTKLRAGIALLEPYAPACQGVDVERLRVDALRLLAHLEHLDPEATLSLNQHLVPSIREAREEP